MKQQKHQLYGGRGIRATLLSLLAVVLLVAGTSCTKNGNDPTETRADSMFESSAGTVADNNVGSVTDSTTGVVTERVTERVTLVPGTTLIPETEHVTSAVTVTPGTAAKSARGGK